MRKIRHFFNPFAPNRKLFLLSGRPVAGKPLISTPLATSKILVFRGNPLCLFYSFLIFCFLLALNGQTQNAIVGTGFSTGWGGLSCPTGAADFIYLSPGAGTSYKLETTANATGLQSWRMGIDAGGTTGQYTITPGLNTTVSPGIAYTLNSNCTTTGTLEYNVPNNAYNYVFKTRDAGAAPGFNTVFFEVQGAIRTISSHTQPIASNVYPGISQRLTVTMSGLLNAGQAAYVRYHNGVGFADASIAQLSYSGTGSDYYVDIPASVHTPGSTISYYFFTSGQGLTIANADADFFTINQLNNGGVNYTYTVTGTWIAMVPGNWSSAGTWNVGKVPPTSENMGDVTINADVTLDQPATVSFLIINTLRTFTASNTTPQILTIDRQVAPNTTLINSGGTWINGTGGSTVVFTSAANFNHTVSGTIGFDNVKITRAGGTPAIGLNFGFSSTINGNFQINAGGFVTGFAPTYAMGSLLQYNSGGTFSRGLEWSAITGVGYPANVQISNSTLLDLGANGGEATERHCAGDLTIDNLSGLSMDFSPMTEALTISGNLVLNGSLLLSGSAGGDLNLEGDFTNNGSFTDNGRTTHFTGINAQNITGNTTFTAISNENTNGTVTVAAGTTITVTGSATLNAAGSNFTINGILRNLGNGSTGALFNSSAANFIISGTGSYEHAASYSGTNLGVIPTATWSSGSTCLISGLVNPMIGSWFSGGHTQTFSNFTWNTPGLTTNPTMGAAILDASNNFTMASTGPSGELRLTNGSTGTINCTNFLQTGGTINMSVGGSAGTINCTGTFNKAGGILTESGSVYGMVNFNGSVSQAVSAGGTISNAISFRCNNPDGINITGSLPINNGATFYRTQGSITGTIVYNLGSTLAYDGNSAITTSSTEWQLINGPINVTINNTAGVLFHATRSLPATGVLNLVNGKLILGANTLIILNNAPAAVTTYGGFVETNADGSLARTILASSNNTYLFPIGNGTHYTPASFNFASNSLAGRQLRVRVVTGTHPEMNNPSVPASYIANRYWVTSLSNSSGTYSYTPSFTYVAGDVVGTIGDIRLSRRNGSIWSNTSGSSASGTILTTTAPLSQATGSLAAGEWVGRVVNTPVTYTWNAGASGDWTSPTNWTPNGVPTSGDRVLFTHNGNYDINNVPTGITLTGLQFSGGGTTNLYAASAGTVNIGGGTNPVFSVAVGTSLVVSGNPSTDLIILTGNTGTVLGNIQLRGISTPNNTTHTLQAEDVAGLSFGPGSYFAAGVFNSNTISGNPFGGIGTSGTVIFQSGSIFEQFDGANPFGQLQSTNKVVFNPGSLYKYSDEISSFSPSFSGRVYSNFEYNSTKTLSATGSSAFSADNFTITKGAINLGILGNPGHVIKGNITINPGASLSLLPNTAPLTINLSGTGVQLISGGGNFYIDPNSTLNVTNNAGVSLQNNITCDGIFNVAAGGVFNARNEHYITGMGAFTLQPDATMSIGSANGIANTGATGNIRINTRNFSSGANYIYNGNTNQSTGTGLPTTIIGFLTIANTGPGLSNIVTLTNNNTVAGILNLETGRFAAGNNQTLAIAPGGLVNGNGYFSNLGNQFIAGTNGGTIEFLGSGTVNGAPDLYKVTINGGVNFDNNARIHHQLMLNSGSFVDVNAPYYATGSTLVYHTGGTYDRSIEWGNTAGNPGYPHHVTVQNATTLNLGTVTPPNLEIAGDLVIGTASSGNNLVTMNDLAIPLKILGNLVIGNPATSNNRLTLSTAAGGDLELSGNFTRYLTTNYFDYGLRSIFIKGNTNTSVNATEQGFYRLLMQKSGGTDLTLNCPVTIVHSVHFAIGKINTSSGSLLTFEPAATITGIPGVSSYINGPVAKQVAMGSTTGFDFPIGKAAAIPVYNPCGILPESINSLTTFTAEYFAGPLEEKGIMGPNMLGIARPGYWDISNSHPSTSTARVKLLYSVPNSGDWVYYNTADNSPFYETAFDPCAECNVAVVHRKVQTWEFTSTSGQFDVNFPEFRFNTDNGFIYSTVQGDFSPFSIGYAYNTVLPLQLTGISGWIEGTSGRINWEITTPGEVDKFELQHSSDGRTFQNIAGIPVNGSTRYSYLDKDLPAGIHYYRLLVREKSGRWYLSKLVVLTMDQFPTTIVGPVQNPVKGSLTVQIISAANQPVQAMITDVSGKMHKHFRSKLLPGQNLWQMPEIRYMTPGIYFVTIITGDMVKATFKYLKE